MRNKERIKKSQKIGLGRMGAKDWNGWSSFKNNHKEFKDVTFQEYCAIVEEVCAHLAGKVLEGNIVKLPHGTGILFIRNIYMKNIRYKRKFLDYSLPTATIKWWTEGILNKHKHMYKFVRMGTLRDEIRRRAQEKTQYVMFE